jgi:hypothetical protein
VDLVALSRHPSHPLKQTRVPLPVTRSLRVGVNNRLCLHPPPHNNYKKRLHKHASNVTISFDDTGLRHMLKVKVSWTSALEVDKWSASRPGRFTPGERAPGTHWVGSWVGPKASLETVEKRKIPSPPPGNRRPKLLSSSP